MRVGRLLWVGVVAFAACRPVTNGRCDNSTQCRTGSVCNTQVGICVLATAPCTPACTTGLVCTAGSCVPLAPVVSVQADANPLFSPSMNQLTIHVESDPLLTLGLLTVEASTAAKSGVARGSIATAQPGDQLVSLTLDAGLEGPGTLLARLAYLGADGVAREARSVSVPVQLDSTGPVVAASVLPAADEVEGWVPRTADTVTLVAKLTDLVAGPAGATLTFQTCPTAATVPCTWTGAPQGPPSQGIASYAFVIPRAAQEAGSEAPLAVTVEGTDAAGNTTQAAARLRIDDLAPAISATPVLVSSGVTGEDGHTWFAGKTHATLVELSVAIADAGAGFDVADVSLVLVAAEIDPGQGTGVPGFLPTTPDGTVHFKVPTARISGREGAVHFSIVAKDRLGHAASVGPSDVTVLWVDDVPPQVTLAAPGYGAASPPLGTVCNRDFGDPGFVCGRTALGAADRVLRDDSVPASFSSWDCGAGVDVPSTTFTAETGGQVIGPAATVEGSAQAPPCANGSPNAKHGMGLTLDVGGFTTPDAPDDEGSFRVRLSQTVVDRTGLSTQSAAAATGDGTVRVSLWRWRSRLPGQAAGDPALVDAPLTGTTPQAGKTVAVPLTASATNPDKAVQLLGPDGSSRARLVLEDGHPDFPSGEVVVADGARLWVPGSSYTCSSTRCSRLWEVPDALAAVPAPVHCPEVTGMLSGLSLRPAGGGAQVEAAIVSVGRALGGDALAYVDSSGSCKQVPSGTIPLPVALAALSGVTLGPDTAFFSHPQGFFSLAVAADGSLSSTVSFVDGSGGPVDLAAPPALGRASGELRPLFNGRSGGSDQRLRQASLGPAGCGPLDCWKPLSSPWKDGVQAAPATHTPVFDPDAVYTVDDQGTLQAFDRVTGTPFIPSGGPAPAGSMPAVSAIDTTTALAQSVSAPLLLNGSGNDNPVLLVQANGLVRLIHPRTRQALAALRVGPFFAGQRPVTPVADGIGGRAAVYLVDGGCKQGVTCAGTPDGAWVWLVQLDVPPMDADASHWPRPARDTCNTRDTEASCK